MASGLMLLRSYIQESNDEKFSVPLLELVSFFCDYRARSPELLERVLGALMILIYSDLVFAEKVVEEKKKMIGILKDLVTVPSFNFLSEPISELLVFLERIDLLKI